MNAGETKFQSELQKPAHPSSVSFGCETGNHSARRMISAPRRRGRLAVMEAERAKFLKKAVAMIEEARQRGIPVIRSAKLAARRRARRGYRSRPGKHLPRSVQSILSAYYLWRREPETTFPLHFVTNPGNKKWTPELVRRFRASLIAPGVVSMRAAMGRTGGNVSQSSFYKVLSPREKKAVQELFRQRHVLARTEKRAAKVLGLKDAA